MRYDTRASFRAVSRLQFLLLFCFCRKSKTMPSWTTSYGILAFRSREFVQRYTSFILFCPIECPYTHTFVFLCTLELEDMSHWNSCRNGNTRNLCLYIHFLYTLVAISKKAFDTLASMYFRSLFSTCQMNSLMNSTVLTECEVEKAVGRFVASSRLLKSRMT